MATATKFGNWSLSVIPPGWEVVPEFGLRRAEKDAFPSNLVLTEEKMPDGMTLLSYVKNQVQIMERLLPQPTIVGPDRIPLPGAEGAQSLRVSYKSNEQRSVVQTQIYASARDLVGIATFTTVEEEAGQVAETFKAVGKALRFTEGT